MEGRIARLEGAFEQTNERLGGIERRLDRIEDGLGLRFAHIDDRFAQMELRFGQIDQKFMWVIGIVVGTWITTILTVLFHH